jgi:regulator of protease activity HflC (stomatin/prohibitin superfamily)
MTLGELLSKAAGWVYDFWPLRIVRQWEQGIRIYAGTVTKSLDSQNGFGWFPGLHWFVPMLGEVRIHECNWEVVETLPQTIVSADGRLVTVQYAITYRVRDLKQYYISIQNQDDTILGAVRASAGAIMPTLTWESMGALSDAMLASVQKRVRGWGLEVKEVVPTTLLHSQALRLISDGVASPATRTTGGED